MSTSLKLVSLPLALVLVACGDNGSTSATGTGSTGPGTATDNPTSTGTSSPTTGMTTNMTSGTGSATDGMTSSPTSTVGMTSTTSMSTTDSDTGTSTTTMGVGSTSTTGMGSSSSDGSTSGVPGSTSGGSSGGGGSTTTGQGVCLPGDGMGMGMIEKSYIWINSQNEGTIAKVNTLTLIEEARYRTGPSGGTESPSRTAVSADGRFVVSNGRGTGRATLFAANKEDCVDKNNNGMIDTSTGPADVRAWLADECMLWTITVPFAGSFQSGPRGVTWTPGEWSFEECKYVNPKVWLGYISQQAGVAHMIRVDGETGIVEATIPVPAFSGSGYAPYGAAVDLKFQPWFTGLRGELVRVNAYENPITVTRIPAPANIQTYGMTVDQDGNPWTGGCSGPVSVYDVEAAKWVSVAGTSACHRGIGAGDKYVWVASNGPCGLVQVDRKTRTLVAKHTPPQCSTAIGISIDVEGFLWLVDQGGWAWKINQDAVAWDKKVIVPGSHYVYSDMTGGQILSVLPQ